jgi:hypothetical protein
MALSKEQTKYTLYTNIAFIQQSGDNGIRIDCHALLIERDCQTMGIGPANRIRAFGNDPAWQVFTYWHRKDVLEVKFESAEDQQHIFIGADNKPKPLFTGSHFIITDGPDFFVQSENPSQPLDVFEHADIERVWAELEVRCAKYCRTPYMAHSKYGPPGSFVEQVEASAFIAGRIIAGCK